MQIDDITKLLNIPYSTFMEWNTQGHKKYDLTLLLLSLDSDDAIKLISKGKERISIKPKYSINTKYITLKKEMFSNDLFWTSKDREKISIENLITTYMQRANQIDTDTLCRLFSLERVEDILEKNIKDTPSYYEAKRQIQYFQAKVTNSSFNLTVQELNDYLKNPKQRVIDYYCKTKGVDKVLKEASELKPKYPTYSTIKKMLEYYKKENLNDSSTKKIA